MKKTIKTILIIIFFICFLGLFLRPRTAYADFKEDAYNSITTYRDYIQGSQNAILGQFITYGYLGLQSQYQDGTVIEYRVNIAVDWLQNVSGGVRINYYSGTYYYTSEDGFSIPHSLNGSSTVYYRDNEMYQVTFLGNTYWFSPPEGGYNPLRLVTYCDIPDAYYGSESTPQLHRVNLYPLPSYSIGTISSPVQGQTFGDLIDTAIDTVAFVPVVTTSPPFQPPATVPPVLPPAVTVTALPAVTDDTGSYYIDYSPYIYADFYAPPATEDISLSPALSASGAIISEGFGWLSDSGMFSVLLVLMLVSFAIYNLI